MQDKHPFVLAFGLLLSIALMGIAANLIARLLQKRRWIAYVGLAIILYVACDMIYRGAYGEVIPVDGVITSQVAMIDEAALTGEPIPVSA